jgi:hypothetical protein
MQRQNPDRLLLPARPFDEDDTDDQDLFVLEFRPRALNFDDVEFFGVAQQQDPTTVLLIPQALAPWQNDFDDDDVDNGESIEDVTLSPRLFRFLGGNNLTLDVAEEDDDEIDDIFRHYDNEGPQRRFSWTPTIRDGNNEDRV